MKKVTHDTKLSTLMTIRFLVCERKDVECYIRQCDAIIVKEKELCNNTDRGQSFLIYTRARRKYLIEQLRNINKKINELNKTYTKLIKDKTFLTKEFNYSITKTLIQ